MAITVGNLLTDPAAQSFISLDAADDYLAPEKREVWDMAADMDQEAALVQASRWLAASMQWQPSMLAARADLTRVGQVAARLAVEALTVDLYAATETTSQIQSERVGSVGVTYFAPGRAQAAGRVWPWLLPMLSGLVNNGSATRFVVRA